MTGAGGTSAATAAATTTANAGTGAGGSFKKPLAAFLSKAWMALSGRRHGHHQESLGDIWSTHEEVAEHCRSLASGSGERVRLCFRNKCQHPLLLCWVDSDGKPFHFYQLDPTDATGSITDDDHVEQSSIGHAFLLAYVKNNPTDDDDNGTDNEEEMEKALKQIQKEKSLDNAVLVGGYRPQRVGLDDEDDAIWHTHLIEIYPNDDKEGETCNCYPLSLRGSQKRPAEAATSVLWKVKVSLADLDRTPLDTSRKTYIATTLGGWPVRLDAALDTTSDDAKNNNNKLNETEKKCLADLEADLKVLMQRLPPHARTALRDTMPTPIWINKSLQYGPAASPVTGKGCCFHPDKAWLTENGMSVEKEGCVELYNLADYATDRHCWGPGGVMLHEYSHAYHYKCLPGGYKNKPLQDCYDYNVKKRKAYDCVPVHGFSSSSQNKKAKAYACTNAMEYFAELSTAFLGGIEGTSENDDDDDDDDDDKQDKKNDEEKEDNNNDEEEEEEEEDDSADDDEDSNGHNYKRPKGEYNKWFPFNRQQLKEHDPKAYQLLKELWKIEIDD